MISKYVLEGGPNSGKSKSVEVLQNSLAQKGYKVYVVQETARKLIEMGLDRQSADFPYYNFLLMLYKEIIFEKTAQIEGKDAIILCDRGRMDPKVYVGESVFEDILRKTGIKSEKEVINSYDGVIFLQTVADGLEKEYIKDEVRIENTEQAVDLQERLFNAWKIHPNFQFVRNSENFNDKIEEIEKVILNFVKQKSSARLSTTEIVEYADRLPIKNNEMLKLVENVLLDKKIIDRSSFSEH